MILTYLYSCKNLKMLYTKYNFDIFIFSAVVGLAAAEHVSPTVEETICCVISHCFLCWQ